MNERMAIPEAHILVTFNKKRCLVGSLLMRRLQSCVSFVTDPLQILPLGSSTLKFVVRFRIGIFFIRFYERSLEIGHLIAADGYISWRSRLTSRQYNEGEEEKQEAGSDGI